MTKPMCVLWVKGAGSVMTIFMRLLSYADTHDIVAVHCQENDGDVLDWEPILRHRLPGVICMKIPGSFGIQHDQILCSWRPAIEIMGLDVTEQDRALKMRRVARTLGVPIELDCPLIKAGKPYAWVVKELTRLSIPLTDRMRTRQYVTP